MKEKYQVLSNENSIFISIILILFGIGLLGMTSLSLAQGDTWTRKQDMPTARGALSGSVVNGKIYAIGGSSTNMGQPLATVEEYDPNTDTWTTKSNKSRATFFHCAAAVNGKIYVIGGDIGGTVIRKLDVYDPTTDSWTTKADMPTARGAPSCAAVNGKIYVMGGSKPPNWASLKTVEEYDPATDTWTTKASMHTGRYCFAASVVDGIIYAIGGASGGSSSSTVEAYDPATDTWTPKAGRMSVGREDHAACTVNRIIYVIGGFRRSGGTLSKVEAYDPVSDTFTEKTSMPTPRMQPGFGVVNGKIYVIGGWQGSYSGAPGLKIVEEYTPTITSVETKSINSPASFVLHQNYPNPFNPETRIGYEVSKPASVVLRIMNLLGQEVCTLVNEDKPVGCYEVTWDGKDDHGQRVASGIYLYRLESRNFIQTRKMILLQ